MSNTEIVILAAGLGSRLGRGHPKCLTVLSDGRSILHQQIANIKHVIPDAKITIVVGFQAENVIEHAPDNKFVHNASYDVTNTSKSLLQALQSIKKKKHVLWLNGDVVFDKEILFKALPYFEQGQSFVTVDTSTVSDEEIKYTVDREGFIEKLSKVIPADKALGEAVGINFIAAKDKEVFMKWLNKVEDQDYFEKGLEEAVRVDKLLLEPLDISESGFNAIEVDFEEDLKKANLYLQQ